MVRAEKKTAFAIRLADKNDMQAVGKIYIDSRRTTYKHILPSDYLESRTYSYAEEKWTKFLSESDCFIFVALDETAAVLAFAACKLHTEMDNCGLLDSLHVAQDYKSQGIGKRLIYSAANLLRQNRINRMMICVLVGNEDALHIYQHLGAKHFRDFVDYIDGIPVNSVALLWEDTTALCDSLSQRIDKSGLS